MSALALEIRLLGRDIFGLAILTLGLGLLARFRPDLTHSLTFPSFALFGVLVIYGAARLVQVTRELRRLYAALPLARRRIAWTRGLLWGGLALLLGFAFGRFLGEMRVGLAAGALVGIAAAAWVAVQAEREARPTPSPKEVRPMRSHRDASRWGAGGRPLGSTDARELALPPRITQGKFLGPLGGGRGLFQGLGGRLLLRSLEVMVLLSVVEVLIEPSAALWVVAFLPLLVYGLTARAVEGLRILQGWPVSNWRALGPTGIRVAIGSVLVVGIVLAATWQRPLDLAAGASLPMVRIPKELGRAARRLPGRPLTTLLPPEESHWRSYWPLRSPSGHWYGFYLPKVEAVNPYPLLRTGLLPIWDEREHFGHSMAFILNARYGLRIAPGRLEAMLGDPITLDALLEKKPGPHLLELQGEVEPRLWPSPPLIRKVGGDESVLVWGHHDPRELRARWQAEKKDGEAYLYEPAIERVERELEPDIRRALLLERAFGLHILVLALAMAALAALLPRARGILLVGLGVLLPFTWFLIRFEPSGVWVVDKVVQHPWFVFGLAGALIMGILTLLYGRLGRAIRQPRHS